MATEWWLRPVSSAAGRRADGGRVEARVAQAARRQLVQRGRLAGAAESAGRAEPGVVDEDDKHVRGALGRAQLSMGGNFASGFFAS